MTVQELIQTASDFSEKTMTLQELLYNPVAWVAVYVVFMLTIGLYKTKSVASGFSDPIESPDYFFATIMFLFSPIWVPLALPIGLAFGFIQYLGKSIVGR